MAILGQEDFFHPTQTIMEAVMFQAHMRLDCNVHHERKAGLARELITRAGLQGKVSGSVLGPTLPSELCTPHACWSIDSPSRQSVMLHPQEMQRIGGLLPGGIRIPGLSGGEKRRLSLCCGSITKPGILFADEPTSGKHSI